MRHPMTIRLDSAVLSKAKERAKTENRTLTNYIETLLRKDLHVDEASASLEVIAPPDIREYKPVPLKGESPQRHEFRKRLFDAILDEGGY